MLKSKVFIALLLTLAFVACRNNPHPQEHEKNDNNSDKRLEEALIEANKSALKEEQRMIVKYISRHQWDMKKLGSGVYYGVYEEEAGPKALEGRNATIHYTIELLSGTTCYSSEGGQPKTFKVGQGDVVTGLHRVMPYLSEGDKAKVIIPSHLAHGISGDQKRIPPKSTLVYDIHLVKVSDK